MSWVAIGVAAVGIGVSLWGSKKQAGAAKDAGKAEARVHDFNADMNDLDSRYIKRQSAESQFIMAEEAKKGLKTIRAKSAKSGITGISSFEVELEAARIYTRNQDIVRREGDLNSYKARKLADLDREKAAAAIEGGKFGAQAAWATGVSNAASFGASYFANSYQARTTTTPSAGYTSAKVPAGTSPQR